MTSRNNVGNTPGKKPSKSQVQKQQAAKRAMAAASGAKAARRKRLLQVLVPVITVVVVVGIFIGVKLGTDNNAKPNQTGSASAAVTHAVTHVPDSVYAAVGAGDAGGPSRKLTGAALTKNGHPEVLYIGAEWCPYCGAERWALAAAVSRFGTLTDLGETASAADDTDPNTPTLSFHGSKYSSDHIALVAKELENGAHQPLDKITPAENKLFSTIGGNGFPFVDIGGKYQFPHQFDPGLLAGKTHAEIADAMSDPTSPIGKAIIGSANILTAAICDVTGGQPAAVCTSKGVVAAKPKLSGAQG